jgi:hypothetical protein
MTARLCLSFVAISLAAPSVPAAQSPQAPTLEAVLACASEYVIRYQRDVAGIVAEESYTQDSLLGGRFDRHGQLRSRGAKHRELRSDLLLVRPEGADGWIQFRDVLVDDREVALRVLLPQSQHRFLFNHVDVSDNSRAAGTWAIDYREVAPGTMIEPALGVLVPREMRESYEQSDGAEVTAVATYSNFRQFQVKVDEKIAPIK